MGRVQMTAASTGCRRDCKELAGIALSRAGVGFTATQPLCGQAAPALHDRWRFSYLVFSGLQNDFVCASLRVT